MSRPTGRSRQIIRWCALERFDETLETSFYGQNVPARVDILFHQDFSDERVWRIWQMWKRLCAKNDLTQLEPCEVYYLWVAKSDVSKLDSCEHRDPAVGVNKPQLGE